MSVTRFVIIFRLVLIFLATVSFFVAWQWFNQPPVQALLVTLLSLVTILLVIRYSIKYLQTRAIAALKRANYPAALKYMGFLSPLAFSHVYCASVDNFLGVILLFADRLEEAEQAFVRSHEHATADQSKQSHLKAQKQEFLYLSRANLGAASMQQQRHREALQTCWQAIDMAPEQSLAYLLAASIHIAQKTELERALHLLDQALEKDKANRASDPAGLRRIAAEAYALKACALTLLERHEEAEAALNHAFNEASGEHRPRFASYQRIVGQVMRLRGEREKAREHFNRAREIDPLGLNNRLATEELEKLEQETGDG